MGIFDAIGSVFDTAISDVTGVFAPATDISSGSVGNLGGGGYVVPMTPTYSTAQFSPAGMMVQNPVQLGAVVAGGRALMTRFPQLWSALVALTQQFGRKFTVENLRGMIRKYGPGLVVGLIGQAAMIELSVYDATHKRRRMNVANVRALRRGLRRLKGFERLSHRVSAQLSRTAHRGRSRARVGRCNVCRKSPCSC
jgi:hypothetical protein